MPLSDIKSFVEKNTWFSKLIYEYAEPQCQYCKKGCSVKSKPCSATCPSIAPDMDVCDGDD
jgi:hypothetical protein